MLTQIMNHINNHFINSYEGIELTFDGSTISGDFANTYIAGQYIYVKDTVINDGAYLISSVATGILTVSEAVTAEVASCTLWGCRPDKGFLDLVADITSWKTDNSGSQNIQSESIGNYKIAYSGGQGASGASNTWKSVFKLDLNGYRKMKPPTDFIGYLTYYRRC